MDDEPGAAADGPGLPGGGQTAERLVADADLDWRDDQRVRFLVENLVEALAPSNVPLLNPASSKAVIDTGGLNVVRGTREFAKDMASAPRIPEMVDRTPFELGRTIAVTPGAVVLRTEVFELIRYTPQTPQVRAVPVLFVPPTINKFYAIDLAPGRSMVEYPVGQGQQVIVMSWRNPQAVHAHLMAGRALPRPWRDREWLGAGRKGGQPSTSLR
ncbi:MAG: hypothetical protein ACXV1K_01145 [Kineosporiaceae bacterium]